MGAIVMPGRAELRRRWRSVVVQLGVSPGLTWPVVGVVALVIAAVLSVNLVAAIPARRAARTRPAVVLRSE
jgi:hypothetical protein